MCILLNKFILSTTLHSISVYLKTKCKDKQMHIGTSPSTAQAHDVFIVFQRYPTAMACYGCPGSSRSFRCCAAMRGFHFRRYLRAVAPDHNIFRSPSPFGSHICWMHSHGKAEFCQFCPVLSTKGLILRLELQPCKCVLAVDTC